MLETEWLLYSHKKMLLKYASKKEFYLPIKETKADELSDSEEFSNSDGYELN